MSRPYRLYADGVLDGEHNSLAGACNDAREMAQANPGVQYHVERVAGAICEATYRMPRGGQLKAWVR